MIEVFVIGENTKDTLPSSHKGEFPLLHWPHPGLAIGKRAFQWEAQVIIEGSVFFYNRGHPHSKSRNQSPDQHHLPTSENRIEASLGEDALYLVSLVTLNFNATIFHGPPYPTGFP